MSSSAIAPFALPLRAGRKPKTPCPEWCAIVEKYAQSARNFYEAAEALPLAPGGDFNHAWERAERARKMCDEARTALLLP